MSETDNNRMLFDILFKIPALNDKATRGILLENLPQGPAGAIMRSDSKLTDIKEIIRSVTGMGRLISGEPALAVLINNALPMVEGTEHEPVLRDLSDQILGKDLSSLFILHLSDLHMDQDKDPDTILQPLCADLRDKGEGLGTEQLDYLIITGDLTNRAKKKEFEKVLEFITKLKDAFKLGNDRCIIMPGNHDLDWDKVVYDWKPARSANISKLKKGEYSEQGKIVLVRKADKYPARFDSFSKFLYLPLMNENYPLSANEQCISFLCPEHRVQFLSMNSCWETDEFFPDRSGIHAGALSRGIEKAEKQTEKARQDGKLSDDAAVFRIAAWHHPVTGNEKIKDDAFMDRLRQAGFKLCVHGHVHEDRADIYGYLHPERKMFVVGAGSFGAPVNDRPESTPRLYNVLELFSDHSKIRVHTRCLRKETGAWEGWAVWPGKTGTEKRTFYEISLK